MKTFSTIEKKWQKRWKEKRAFEAKEGKKKKFYVLEMFPYPSGSGLHMGHAFNYTIGDIYARYKRMQGFNVLYPMGYDAFGLPAENAAIKAKSHPKKFTEQAIKNFIKQQQELGLSYDWTRTLKTCDPEYYTWNQWFFIQFFKKGLTYKKKASVNWCPECNTVLANEQVHAGKCWRHKDTEVEIKELEQWFIKTTAYADELLKDIDTLNWPERIKNMQKNWIGKSQGAEITFMINDKPWKIYTTRPDTLYGVTFMVISAQHPQLMSIVPEKNKKEVLQFSKEHHSIKQEDLDKLEKEGMFTGAYASHPLTKEKIPIYVGNFVLAEYGAGMVMAVPSHDQRDFDFAKKYNIPMKQVIQPKKPVPQDKAFSGEGKLINSGKFNGVESTKVKKDIVIHLKKKKLGKKATHYKLRDWLISRQRYWGTPIPIIYCDQCGTLPVPEKELPVRLPEKVTLGKGNPLEANKEFLHTTCPKCKGKAKRETDTMDTFMDSSWYFLRYMDNKNKKQPFDKKKTSYWMPVDIYIGGAEHATMHLIYARFFTKILRDLKLLNINEPFPSLFNQGMLHKDGHVMSKSRGNVVLPEEVSNKYGIDTARFFLTSIASPDKDREWNDHGIEGSLRFMNKIIEYVSKVKIGTSSPKTQHKVNKAIQEITIHIENFEYNIAIIKFRNLFDSLEQEISKKDVESIIKLLSPFCPHIAEELWEQTGHKSILSLESWPKADKNKINKKFEQEDIAIDNLVRDIMNIIMMLKEKQNKETKKIYIYVLPKEKNTFNAETLQQRVNKEVKIYTVNDKEKYDPEGKAKKAKPGKPAIYLE
jgi:leucyl-tRNA synthetase